MFAFDHVVLHVHDLNKALDDFTVLGFTVIPGGELVGGTMHNALICLPDGAYLELLAAKDRSKLTELRVRQATTASEFERRFIRYLLGDSGLVDFALLPDDMDTAVARLVEGGIGVEGPLPGGRQRPDGTQLAWRFAFPKQSDLPFLLVDDTPRELRIPTGDARRHKNGVSGLTGVVIAAKDPAKLAAPYATLLGQAPVESSFADAGATLEFVLPSGHWVKLVGQPVPGSALDTHLREHGDGLFQVNLISGHGDGFFNYERAHQVRIYVE